MGVIGLRPIPRDTLMYGDVYFCNFFDYLSKNQFVACFHLQVKIFYFSFIICDQRMLSNLLLSQ